MSKKVFVKHVYDSVVLIYTNKKFDEKDAVFGFDLDGTIVTTSSGKKFPVDENDWQYSSYIKYITKLSKQDGKLVIVTNQAYKNKEMHIARVLNIIQDLSTIFTDIMCLIALEKDVFRKPHSTLWT